MRRRLLDQPVLVFELPAPAALIITNTRGQVFMYQTLGHSKQYIRTEIRYESYPVSQTTQSTMGRIRDIRYDLPFLKGI